MEKQKLNTTLIYILSILGFLCCCFGGIGIVPSGIAFFIANGKVKEYENAPENFENGEAMKTAKIIAMVVLIINILYLGYTIYRIATVGWDEMMEQSRELSEQWGFEQ
ncbi:MAG: hypothetical protein MK211_03415 [Flavobacteriales bacterium]|jgi:Trk-type K+ transport system membrane component|uniref:CCC motif membrane protein n=1 Tax=Candidatus Ulvibacter alkanivorans TaxID=2267620 RepID=UPI000DF1296C|nr:CCC motif membrane protein [Candidatus Ulvibacter alkanivorans]MCH2489175.1 hypothetical protein [Flavobacteriales bacterium]